MKLRQMLGNRTINYDKYANGIYIQTGYFLSVTSGIYPMMKLLE